MLQQGPRFCELALVAPTAVGVLRSEDPLGEPLERRLIDLLSVHVQRPQRERRVLRLRSVARQVGIVTPTPVRFLAGHQRGGVSLKRAAAIGSQFAQEDNRQPVAVDILLAGFRLQ